MMRKHGEVVVGRTRIGLGVVLAGGIAGSVHAQSTGMAKPYRLVWVDDLVNSYGAAQVKLFPEGPGDGAAPEVMRFRLDEAGNIVGTAIETPGGTAHARAAVWVASGAAGTGSPTRTRLAFPGMTVGGTSGIDTVATSVSTAGGVLRIGGGYIQAGVCTPALWSASVIPGTPPTLSSPTQLWSTNDVGLVQAVGTGASPMIGGGVYSTDPCNRPLPFMHDTAGPASPTGAIDENCGFADPARTVAMSMWGSTYAIFGSGPATYGFGWRVCFPCDQYPQPPCGPYFGNVEYEQFARWRPGTGAGSWQFTPTGCTTTNSRAVSAIAGAAAGWSVSRACAGTCIDFKFDAHHATVFASTGNSSAFMDIHSALNPFDDDDDGRLNSKAADLGLAPISWCGSGESGWCPNWLVVGSRFGTGIPTPIANGSNSPRGVLWQGDALGNWCGKRAEALSVNLPGNSGGQAGLEVRAVHGIGPGGTAVAIGEIMSVTGAQTSYWGTTGLKLILMTHPADFNGDLHVAGDDLGVLLGAWGSANPQIDLDGSGVVDGPDLGILLAGYSGTTTFVTIPKWNCSGGWHIVPVVAAGTVASQALGFDDLEELGSFAATLDSTAAELMLFEASVIAQSVLN